MNGSDKRRQWMRVSLASIYVAIGAAHLLSPDTLMPMMPDWVPEPRLVILMTGLCEIAGAVALLTQRLRKVAGWALALYAICVFPANVKHAFEGIRIEGLPDSWWYHGPRLAMQPVIVWWALYAAAITDWPFGKPKS